jgi:hypothetical protein
MDTISEEHVCKNCGNHFKGHYCNECGEKVILPQDRSFRTFLNSMFLALTFAYNRFVKTVWVIITRPGFLSKEFAEGRRVKYLKPLSIFFFLNLIYFLFPLIQLFNASLRTQLNSIHGKVAATTVARKMIQLGVQDVNSFSIIYDQKTTRFAKMLVIVFAVLVSLPLNVMYRSRQRYFTDHVGLSVELVCFNLLMNTLLLTVVVNLLQLGTYVDEFVLTAVFGITNLYFLFRSGFTFYNERGARLVLKSILMIVVLKIALEVYRLLLFYITIWSL